MFNALLRSMPHSDTSPHYGKAREAPSIALRDNRTPAETAPLPRFFSLGVPVFEEAYSIRVTALLNLRGKRLWLCQ